MSFLSITIRWTFFQSCLPKKSFGWFAQSYLVIFKELLSYRSTPLKVKPSLSLDLFLKSKAAHKELSSTLCQAFFPTFFLFFLKKFFKRAARIFSYLSCHRKVLLNHIQLPFIGEKAAY